MLKCAIYARVSTEFDEQATSIETQIDYFNNYIYTKDNLVLYKVYVDKQTGTDFNREGVKELIEDSKAKRYDTLLVKSISRFGRNQSETIRITNLLHELDIQIIFVEDGIDSKKDRNLIGLFAWLAENESKKISERVKFTIKNNQRRGLFVGNKPPYGYSVKEHKLYINEAEAEVVKLVYNLYINEGFGLWKIVDYLNDNNIKPRNASKWAKTNIVLLLTNPVYTGNTYSNKTEKIDVLSKKIKRNSEEDWIITLGTHEVLVDFEMYNKVQQQRAYRKELLKNNTKYSGENLFSNIVRCGRCSGIYIRKKVHDVYVYSCRQYERRGTLSECKSREAIKEEHIKELLHGYIIEMLNNNEIIDNIYKEQLSIITVGSKDAIKKLNSITKDIEKFKNKQDKLLEFAMDGTITKEQFKIKNDEIESKVVDLQSTKHELEVKLSAKNELENKYITFKKELYKLKDIECWDNQLLRGLFPTIIVYDRQNIEILTNIHSK